MSPSPQDVKARLRGIYDGAVETRDRKPPPAWELAERDAFTARLEAEAATSLLELGAATGVDAEHFARRGLRVVATDLSPAMVRRCRERGLDARTMDATDLRFDDASFDAAYARNCFIHVPEAEIERALAEVARVLRPGGLFYLSVYGGSDFEGIWEGDNVETKRFFAFRSDPHLRGLAERHFDVETFRVVPKGFGGYHYQSLVLRTPGDAGL